jgi:antitoxin component YwqK of YwqJK toxin-antitoxin module
MPSDDSATPTPALDHYDNGQVRFRGANLDGEMHGPWEFFRKDGSLMRAGRFDRGRQVGLWRTYDRSGTVVKETTFERKGEDSSG